jgi:hypothetical protein
LPFCITESADPANLPKCKEIGEYICTAYPGYTWSIRIDGGLLIIKNSSISVTAAAVRRYDTTIAQDATRLKHDVVMAAGEFLEAAGLSRLHNHGGVAKGLEGLPKGEKFQPLAPILEAAK